MNDTRDCMETINNNNLKAQEKCETIAEFAFADRQIDEQKQKRSNLSEEQRLKKNEYARERRAKFTEEQRMMEKERFQKRRANLTEEQRAKRNEYTRKWRANFTEEQRLKEKEQWKKRRTNFTEEQRLRKNELTRKWRDNFTEEQRLKEKEYYHKKQANLTEEKRSKMNEYARKKYANLTEEQLAKKKEYERNRRAKLAQSKHSDFVKNKNNKNNTTTEERCIYNSNNFCNRNIEFDAEQLTISEEEKLENENALQKLIEQMRCVKKISQIDSSLLRRILQLLSLKYPQNILLQSQNALNKLIYEIDSIFLIKLLGNWKSWTIDDDVTNLSTRSCNDLFNYLCNNFVHIRLHRDISLLAELNNSFSLVNYIKTSCSLKRLKSLFHRKPHHHTDYYREDDIASDSCLHPRAPFPSSIIDLPYISTHLSLPNFSMEHVNVHSDEYHLINIGGEIKSNLNLRKGCELYLEVNDGVSVSETYLTETVAKFLSQLKIAVENSGEENISYDRKIEIMMVLIGLENDIAYCANTIQTNMKYTISLAPNPYTRYLGYPDDEDMNISIPEQKLLNEPTFNVRLREVRYPRISFTLRQFSVPYKLNNNNIHFIYDETFLNNLNNCISYKCLLCDEDLGSDSERISDHLMQYHGSEPDWECVKCSETFSDDFLIKHRWRHSCQRL